MPSSKSRGFESPVRDYRDALSGAETPLSGNGRRAAVNFFYEALAYMHHGRRFSTEGFAAALSKKLVPSAGGKGRLA